MAAHLLAQIDCTLFTPPDTECTVGTDFARGDRRRGGSSADSFQSHISALSLCLSADGGVVGTTNREHLLYLRCRVVPFVCTRETRARWLYSRKGCGRGLRFLARNYLQNWASRQRVDAIAPAAAKLCVYLVRVHAYCFAAQVKPTKTHKRGNKRQASSEARVPRECLAEYSKWGEKSPSWKFSPHLK